VATMTVDLFGLSGHIHGSISLVRWLAGTRPQFAFCVKLSTARLQNVPVRPCEALLAVARGTKSSSTVLKLAGSGRAPAAMVSVSMARDWTLT